VTTAWTQLRRLMPQPLPARFPADTVVLFPPRDNAQIALSILVGAAKSSIRLEMFTYCDAVLDAAVHAKAAQPGFSFQATFDASQATQEPDMAKLLTGWANDPRVVTGKSEKGQLIHRKIIVVDDTYVVGGSTNWTFDGERLEDNELVIRRNPVLAGVYAAVLDANHARLVGTAS
jgi:phosphatidylserine/phosphatidylglycerophosphate/cardiolipin synthase-like enzyme